MLNIFIYHHNQSGGTVGGSGQPIPSNADFISVRMEGVSATSPTSNSPDGQTAMQMVDDSLATKFTVIRTDGIVNVLVSFASPRVINSYMMRQAQDGVTRLWRNWSIEGSNNGGQSWELIHSVANEQWPTIERVYLLNESIEVNLLRIIGDNAQASDVLTMTEFDVRMVFETESRMSGSTISSPTANSPGGQGAAQLIDGNIATKFLSFANSMTMVVSFPEDRVIDCYNLTTAEDAPERDWRSWSMEYSIDNGVSFIPLHTKSSIVWNLRNQTRGFEFDEPVTCNAIRVVANNDTASGIVGMAELDFRKKIA